MFGIKLPEYTYDYFDGNELKQKTLSFFQKHIIRRLGFAFRETYCKNVANKAYELTLGNQFKGDTKKLLNCIARANKVYGEISYNFSSQKLNIEIAYTFTDTRLSLINIKSSYGKIAVKTCEAWYQALIPLGGKTFSFEVLKRAIDDQARGFTAQT